MNLERLKKFFTPPSMSALAREPRVVEMAKTLVAYYYYIIPIVGFIEISNRLNMRPLTSPPWSLWWASGFDRTAFVNGSEIFFIAAAFVGIFFYRYRAARILVFLAFALIHALESSSGSVNHQLYNWVYTSFIFIFLPDIWDTPHEDANKKFLLTVWWAQALVMLTYTMAGLNKVIVGLVQFFSGQINSFSPDAFAYHIAYWVPLLQVNAIFAPFIVEHPLLGYLPYLFVIVMQVSALYTVIRPRLQKIWAAFLVLFHIGTYLTMGISFFPVIPLLIVLFFNSPFLKAR